jgi:hypothetical protein
MKVKHFLIILFASLIIIPGTSKAARVWTYFDVNNNQLQAPSDKEIKELAVKRVSNDNVTHTCLIFHMTFQGRNQQVIWKQLVMPPLKLASTGSTIMRLLPVKLQVLQKMRLQ